MRKLSRSISLLLIAASVPLSAQLRPELRLVRSDRTMTEAMIATDTLGEGTLTSATIAGERIVRISGGRFGIVRRFALSLPTSSVSFSVSSGRTDSYPLPEGFRRTLKPDTSFRPLETARLIDIAPHGGAFAATLEAIIAIFDPNRGTMELVRERPFVIAHGPLPDPLFRVLGPVMPGAVPTKTAALQRTEVRAAGQTWYRLNIDETGFYRFDRTYLISAGVSSAELSEIRKLRLYESDGSPVPENLTAPRSSGLREIPRLINDANGNGTLDEGESVVWYGRAVRFWRYDPPSRSFLHTMNPYSEHNALLFTFDPAVDGRDMDSVNSQTGPAVAVSSVVERIAVDQDRINFVNSGRRWVGESFDYEDRSAVFTTMLHGLAPGNPISYRAVFFSRSASIDTFRVTENDAPVLGGAIMYTSDVTSTDQVSNYAYESPVQTFQHPGSLPDNRSVLRFAFGTNNRSAKGWLDWFEIFYRRSLTALNDRLLFPSPDTTAVLEYTVRNLSSRSVLVADVSDMANVRRVAGVEFDIADASLCRFRLQHTSASVRELAVIGTNGYLTPPAPKKISEPVLRTATGPASFIIISPKEFLEEAERLRSYRESHDSLRTMVVDVESIYNEFGGGLPDPMAIRDFLVYARAHYAGPLRYVLFFGNGHFDYRNISTSIRNWIPPYETAESNTQIDSYASDDYLAMLDVADDRISVAIGRLPGRSLADMRSMVDKIFRHETTAPLDPWRNRVTFVADDGVTSTNPFEGSLHTGQAENLARLYTPASFEQRKIYIVEYPNVNSASGRRKPMANEAIIDAFNRGTLMLNFTGHGRVDQWTHEAVFTNTESIPRLTNHDRLTFLVAATCGYAQWDRPNQTSGGELLMTKDDGGAIGVVTATRSVYSFDNAELNQALYTYLFRRDATGAAMRIGDAFYAMKQIRYETNDRKYHLLGDPTSRLLRPQGSASVDTVNGTSTASVAIVPSLGQAVVRGSIRDGLGNVRTDFTGTGLLEFTDAKRNVSVAEWGGFSFEVLGSPLYRGEITVTAGEFRAQVPVPKDVSFGARARMALYATSGSSDAVGVTEQITIQGTDTTAAIDTTGPVIEIAVGSASFRPGDVVPEDPTLIVSLADASGINTSTVGIGHRLEAEVDENGAAIELGDSYRGDLDTYQSGRAVRQLTGLSEGRHTVRVRAWDIRNNSSTAEVAFEVRGGSDVDVFQVANYPNPMTEATTFTFQRTSGAFVDVEVRVYTVAGRLIQRLELVHVSDQFVRIPWDGRDREGAHVANGVYLYKVIVRTIDRSNAKEFIGKLAVLR